MKTEVVVEGKKLIVLDRDFFQSQYVVFEEKIWRWFGKSGAGKDFVLSLERPSSKEVIHVKYERMNEVKWIINPTGYMTI
jgi:hypothetical protein